MTYQVSPEKLQELNVLVDKGGHVPGAVSDALAALEVATAAGDKAAAKVAFDRAVSANINGNEKAWTAVQGWHDEVKASDTGPIIPPRDPVGPPGEWPPSISAGQVSNWAYTPANHVRHIQLATDGLIGSSAGSGGVPVWGRIADTQATIPFPQDSNTKRGAGAPERLRGKAGQWYSTYPEAAQDMRVTMEA